jgi:hypothetical protein
VDKGLPPVATNTPETVPSKEVAKRSGGDTGDAKVKGLAVNVPTVLRHAMASLEHPTVCRLGAKPRQDLDLAHTEVACGHQC